MCRCCWLATLVSYSFYCCDRKKRSKTCHSTLANKSNAIDIEGKNGVNVHLWWYWEYGQKSVVQKKRTSAHVERSIQQTKTHAHLRSQEYIYNNNKCISWSPSYIRTQCACISARLRFLLLCFSLGNFLPGCYYMQRPYHNIIKFSRKNAIQ